jgi:hypothetical protein
MEIFPLRCTPTKSVKIGKITQNPERNPAYKVAAGLWPETRKARAPFVQGGTVMGKAMMVIMSVLTFSGPALGAYIYVPDDYPTIQAAINAVKSGDTVIVRPGTYSENIDLSKNSITVTSEKGPHLTTIDGNQKNSVVNIQYSDNSVLHGFTIMNGRASLGGGIY